MAASQKALHEHRSDLAAARASQSTSLSHASYALTGDTTNNPSESSLEVQLLRGQYEREKRLLDQKVRQLAELESSQQDAKALAKENSSLRQMNSDLTAALKTSKQSQESAQFKLEQQQKELGYKLQLIEDGCGRELILRLKNLRDEVNLHGHAGVNQSNMMNTSTQSSYAEDSVENMAKEISSRVKWLAKQRETLQAAVNTLQ